MPLDRAQALPAERQVRVKRCRGRIRPGKRQTMVRGLRIVCRNISVSLKDAGPRVADSTEKDALRRSSTPSETGL